MMRAMNWRKVWGRLGARACTGHGPGRGKEKPLSVPATPQLHMRPGMVEHRGPAPARVDAS